MALTISELPSGTSDLYIVRRAGAEIGIGTPDELRGLIEEGVLPDADELTFDLEWVA